MRETQQSINEWVEVTFGPVGSHLRVATRANQEMAELLHALSANDRAKAADETADVMIVLLRLAERLHFDLLAHLEHPYDLGNPLESAASANKQLASLIAFLSLSTAPPDPEHVVDIASTLMRLGSQCGCNIFAEIDNKMTINRNRVWELDGTGCGHHRERRAS